MNDIASNSDSKLRVLLTGFDAFEMNGVAIDKNTSGEAVKLIQTKKCLIEETCDIELYPEVIPVQYQFIDEYIPQLWKKVQPHLSIHVGVSNIAKGLELEKLAEKAPYLHGDDQSYRPHARENPCAGPERLTTDLVVEDICREFNRDLPEGSVEAEVSCEAGKYVCEYIYYTSMALYEQTDGRKSSLFVHVPHKTEDEDIREISKQLEHLLKICVKYTRINNQDVY